MTHAEAKILGPLSVGIDKISLTSDQTLTISYSSEYDVLHIQPSTLGFGNYCENE